MMAVPLLRVSHIVLGVVQNYQSRKEIFGLTPWKPSALMTRVSKIYQNSFKGVIGIVTPNKPLKALALLAGTHTRGAASPLCSAHLRLLA